MSDIFLDPNNAYDNSGLITPNSNLVKIENFIESESKNGEGDLEEDEPEYVDLNSKNLEEHAMETEDRLEENQLQISNDEELVKEFINNSLYMKSDQNMSSKPEVEDEDDDDDDDDDDDEASSSNEDDTKCQICEKMFLDQEDLNLHYKSRRLDDRRYMCCNCQKVFRDNTQLKVHARKHTGEKPFECTVCSKKFTVNGNLNKHMRIHTGEKRFECTDCGRKFTQFAHLEDHTRTHSGERPFICDYCQASFKTKARLRKHRKSHSEDNPSKKAVKCPRCDIVLKNNRQLAGHLSIHMSEEEGPHVCHLCGKVFAQYINMQKHLKTHLSVKSFECHFCERMFGNASHLRRHMNSHSGFRPYSCEVCKRPFPSSQNLKRHMLTHTGEKPFSCVDCNKRFLSLENLNRHRRTHTGEKPFGCEICGKTFAHSTTVKEHTRAVHTGEKPFSCTLCDKTFAVSKMLYRHTREKHPKYFPEFKKEQSLTPNMRKAREKMRMKRELICEDDVKKEIENSSDTVVKSSTEVKIKQEIIDEEMNEELDNKIKMEMDLFQKEAKGSFSGDKSEVDIKTEDNISFIKIEKQDVEDDS